MDRKALALEGQDKEAALVQEVAVEDKWVAPEKGDKAEAVVHIEAVSLLVDEGHSLAEEH